MERMNLLGFSFDPQTGRVFDDQGREQPYTFQFVTVVDQTGKITIANPTQFATRDTAEKVLAYLQKLEPTVNLKLVESVWAGGPFCRPAPEYSVQLPGGTVMNCGLVANTIMRSPQFADAMLRAEIAMYSGKSSQ